MPKSDLTAKVEPRCRRVAEQLGFELVEVCLDRENTGRYLRIYIDRPEGMDLDGCERYHRLIQPLVEDYDYDFLEVSSPGADRPLKRDRDFERALGSPVEARLFKAEQGRKEVQGILAAYGPDTVTLQVDGVEQTLSRKALAWIRPAIDLSEVLDIEEDGSLAVSEETVLEDTEPEEESE